MRIAICVGTYHRCELLRELLRSLARLVFWKNAKPALEVIVVDNDPSGSAREVCREFGEGIAVRYVIEPRRGIANVRNRAVSEASAFDFVAFIDDDEAASPQWLDELLATQKKFELDVVTGPIRPKFIGQIPEWAKKSECFHRPEFHTGTLLNNSPTSNVLIAAAVFKAIPRFNQQFQLTGGEDTHFFLSARRAGFLIGWSQEAVVYEAVSRKRANLRWILHRGFQGGNSWVLSESLLCTGARFRIARFCKACGHIARGLAASALSVFVSRGLAVKHLREVFLGAGMLAGLFGHKYQAYDSAKPSSATTS